MPSQLVLTRDPLIKDVVTSKLLQSQLSLDYLHADVANVMNPSLRHSLDIQTLNTQHLIEVGKVILARLGEAESEEGEMSSALKIFKFALIGPVTCTYKTNPPGKMALRRTNTPNYDWVFTPLEM